MINKGPLAPAHPVGCAPPLHGWQSRAVGHSPTFLEKGSAVIVWVLMEPLWGVWGGGCADFWGGGVSADFSWTCSALFNFLTLPLH